MKFTHLCALVLCSASLIAQNEPVFPKETIPTAQEERSQENQQLATLYGDFLENAAKLSLLIESLAGIVSQTNLVKAHERSATLEWLQDARKINQALMRRQLQTLSLEQMSALFSTLSLIIGSIEIATQKSFVQRPFLGFDANKIEKLEVFETERLSFNQLEKLVALEQIALARIESFVHTNGLSRLNIAYRNFSQTLNEYKIPAITAAAGTGLAIGTLFFLMLDEDQIKNQTLKATHKKMSDLSKKLDGVAPLLNTARKALKVVFALGALTHFKKIFKKIDTKLRGEEILNKHTNHEYVADISLDDACFNHIRPLLTPFYRIAEFLQNPAQFAFTGLKNCQAILLIAPPGYGKSFTARAAAGLFNKSAGRTAFISISTLDLIQQVQENAEAINGIIEEARDNAPCVLWIDELHLLGGGLQIDKNAFILQDMLKALDMLNQNADPQKMVFVIGATNRPDLLDSALLRHGRFSQIITLPEPSPQDRISLLEALCKQSAIDPRQIDLAHIASITPGASPSTLSALFEHANFLAKRENKCLETNHLYEAINTIIRNIQPHTPYSDEERHLIATQVSAEALYYACTNKLSLLDAITIRPIKEEIQEQYDWMTKMPDKKRNLFTQHRGAVFLKKEKQNTLTQEEIAGKIAQSVATKLIGQSPLTNELQKNKTLIFNSLLAYQTEGLPLSAVSKKQQDQIKEQTLNELHRIEREVETILRNNQEKLVALTKVLEEKEFLKHDEIEKICENHHR